MQVRTGDGAALPATYLNYTLLATLMIFLLSLV